MPIQCWGMVMEPLWDTLSNNYNPYDFPLVVTHAYRLFELFTEESRKGERWRRHKAIYPKS